MGSYRKEKSFCTPEIEDCSIHHPLGLTPVDFDEDLILITSPCPKDRKQRKSRSFRSNLSSSLQAIKSRVTSSFSALNLLNLDDDSFSDASLWEHPYIFPRLSSELRPTPFAITPSKSQRQYFNPRSAPVPFEEQQHHWQKALSSSDCSETLSCETPMIQMQTYTKKATPRRSRRGSSAASPNPRSEAGRAMSGKVPMPSRQREPRENSDFLRVIVLEMNMRREGKFEEGASGRAKIWLPPRKQAAASNSVFCNEEDDDEEITSTDGHSRVAAKKIPRRWVSVSME
jgi:hypothetical protein